MKKIFGVITSFGLTVATLIIVGGAPAAAQGSVQRGVKAAQGSGVPSTLFGDGGVITTITNIMLFIAGALAVIMIIFGGLRYATSAGNASAVTAAKNTILYALVGLIVAFLAFAAVNFVLNAVTPSASSGFTDV